MTDHADANGEPDRISGDHQPIGRDWMSAWVLVTVTGFILVCALLILIAYSNRPDLS